MLKKKWLGLDSVGSSQLLLEEAAPLRAAEGQGAVDLLKYESGKLKILKLPELQEDPVLDGDAVRKAYLSSVVAAETAARVSAIADEAAIRAQGDVDSLNSAKEYTDLQIAGLVDSAPQILDTLGKIAAQLAQDESVVTALTTTIANNLTEAKGYTDQKVAEEAGARSSAIAQEVEDRNAAILVEKTRAEGVEGQLQSAISQEISDRTQAISDEIQARLDGIAAEAALRESGDLALGSRITTEVGQVAADLQSEIGARTQAITDLTARVATEEGARASAVSTLEGLISSEQSARESADQALQTAINNEIGAREQAILAEKGLREAADQALQTAIGQEVNDRVAAVLEEKGLREQAIQTVTNLVNTEVSDRQTAVSEEATARALADIALGGRIDQEITDRTTAINSEILARTQGDASTLVDAKAYADQKIADLIGLGTPETLDTLKEIADQLASDESVVGALTQTVANNLIEAKSYADDKVAAEVIARDAAIEAEAVLRNAAIQAAITQSNTSYTELQGALAQEIIDRTQAVSTEATARSLADQALDARVAQLELDPVTKTYVDGLNSSMTVRVDGLQTSLESEVSRATSAEEALGVRIDGVVSDLSAEVSRAQGVESQIQSGLSAEVSRAESAESALGVRIDGVVSDLAAEVVRATAAESLLTTQLTAEVMARGDADSALKAELDSFRPMKVKKILTAEDVAAGFVEVDMVGELIPGSVDVFVDNVYLAEGEGEEYAVAILGGKLRVTFAGPYAAGGQEAASVGDRVVVKAWGITPSTIAPVPGSLQGLSIDGGQLA